MQLTYNNLNPNVKAGTPADTYYSAESGIAAVAGLLLGQAVTYDATSDESYVLATAANFDGILIDTDAKATDGVIAIGEGIAVMTMGMIYLDLDVAATRGDRFAWNGTAYVANATGNIVALENSLTTETTRCRLTDAAVPVQSSED